MYDLGAKSAVDFMGLLFFHDNSKLEQVPENLSVSVEENKNRKDWRDNSLILNYNSTSQRLALVCLDYDVSRYSLYRKLHIRQSYLDPEAMKVANLTLLSVVYVQFRLYAPMFNKLKSARKLIVLRLWYLRVGDIYNVSLDLRIPL